MTSEAKWHYNSEEEKKLADHIISLEKAALEKWFKGELLDMLNYGQKKIYIF